MLPWFVRILVAAGIPVAAALLGGALLVAALPVAALPVAAGERSAAPRVHRETAVRAAETGAFGMPDAPVDRRTDGLSAERPAAGDPLTREEIALFQPGDFILRRGRGIVSRLIVNVLGGDAGVSHSGILNRDERGEWFVIHSVSRALSDRDGIQLEPLQSFAGDSVPGSTVVVRLRASAEEREGLVRVAEDLLAREVPFDATFRLDNGAIYCSELLWLALPADIRHGTTVFQAPGNVIRFESFLDPRYFELIIDRR